MSVIATTIAPEFLPRGLPLNSDYGTPWPATGYAIPEVKSSIPEPVSPVPGGLSAAIAAEWCRRLSTDQPDHAMPYGTPSGTHSWSRRWLTVEQTDWPFRTELVAE